MARKRIILASLGSSGDLHPYMAIALELKARGYRAVVGTSPASRYQIEGAGLEFVPIRPDFPIGRGSELLLEAFSDPKRGTQRIVRQVLTPSLRATYEDLSAAARDADLFITSPTVLPAGLVAAKIRTPWIGTVHTPALLFSTHHLLTGAMSPKFGRVKWLRKVARPAAMLLTKPWARSLEAPMKRLWRDEGQVFVSNGMWSGVATSKLVLGLFSPLFSPIEANALPQMRVTGFPLYDGSRSGSGLDADLEEFLGKDPPPIVFALGSTLFERTFFRDSLQAAVLLKQRGLFLIGRNARTVLPETLPEGMMVATYAPYSAVFSRASVVVHHGGVGTTALAMRAGRPMLVVPQAHDQPDNAARAERAGVARILHRTKYTASRAAAELKRLLTDDRYRARATEVGNLVRQEDGVRGACDAVEEFLSSRVLA